MRRAILLLTLVGAMLFAFSGVVLAQQGGRTTPEDDDTASFKSQDRETFAPGKLIVKVNDDASEEDLEALNRRQGGARTDKELAPNLVPGLYGLTLPPGLEVREAVGRYEGSTDVVDYAEPDFRQSADAAPNDPYYINKSLWGLDKIQAPAAWNLTTGKDVTGTTYTSPLVAIIDEGVQNIGHSDLKANAWTNYDEWGQAAGKDDSPNSTWSKVDDFYGWDEYRNDNSVYDSTQDDHGTHVAGTIGGRGNNGIGVTGVNWQTDMAVCKFLGPSGGYTSDAIRCLEYVVAELGAKVSNNSWGGGGYSQGLYDAIGRAGVKGHLFVAAAGNGGSDGVGDDNDKTPHYPSSYKLDNIIAVASTTSTDARSGFSNYGATSVDLGAPGSGIYSTLPSNKYGSKSGTSMATPHVTGTVALIWAKYPTLTSSQVKDRIIKNVDTKDSMSGKTVSGGRLNAYKAVNNSAGAP